MTDYSNKSMFRLIKWSPHARSNRVIYATVTTRSRDSATSDMEFTHINIPEIDYLCIMNALICQEQ